MNILIFGGTTEGRVLCEELIRQGHTVTVSVATVAGAEEVKDIMGLDIKVGRLDQDRMYGMIIGSGPFDLIIDATHPYALEVTENIKIAALKAGIEMVAVVRDESELSGCLKVDSISEAADMLKGVTENILITTGSKEIGKFATLEKENLYVRVLPTKESIDACEKAGIPHSNIIAMHGPFTKEMNEVIYRQFGIKWVVTKDSGKEGGFAEKVEAAKESDVRVIVIRRRNQNGKSVDDILRDALRTLRQ